MTEPARTIAIYADLQSLPDTMIGEIINGELIATPRPSRRHADAASSLSGEIVPPYKFGRGGPGGWIILVEPEIGLGDNIIVPDLAGWKRERFPYSEDHNWISAVPDWICEIISPSTAGIDRVKKMGLYAQHGVPYYWIIDPLGRTLEVFENGLGKWSLVGTYADGDLVKAPPFHECEIDLKHLWQDGTP